MRFVKANFKTLKLKDLRHYSQLVRTNEWIHIRSFLLDRFSCCMKCSRKSNLQIDHIKPISLYPEFGLSCDNIQILCKVCNVSKSNKTCDSYISDDQKKEIKEIFDGRNFHRYTDLYLLALACDKYAIKKFYGHKTSKIQDEKRSKFLASQNNKKKKLPSKSKILEKLVINIDDESYKTKTILRKKTLS
jgi:hypothetical protein